MKPLTKKQVKYLDELVEGMKANTRLAADDAAAVEAICKAAKEGDDLLARYLFRSADTAVREQFGEVSDRWMNGATEPETFSETFTAKIYVGSKIGYSEEVSDGYHKTGYICKAFCDRVGLCVTSDVTTFIHKEGFEVGHEIGIIQYPRFVREIGELRKITMELAILLKKECQQFRVTVVFSDFTVTIGDLK